MASRFLIGQKLDDDPWLPTAVGAGIEVHAQVLARARRTPRSHRLPAEPAQTIRRHFPARADPQEHQPAGPGGQTRAAARPERRAMARRQTALAGRAARTSGPALLLGALVQRLQSRGRHRGQPPADVRAAGAGGDRADAVLWICGRRRRRAARQGEAVHRGGPPPVLCGTTRNDRCRSARQISSPTAPAPLRRWC